VRSDLGVYMRLKRKEGGNKIDVKLCQMDGLE